MTSNIVIHDGSGANVTVRAIDPGSGILTEQSGNELNSQVDGHSATLGITTGAAVTTNATGTLQQYLRGLVTMITDMWDGPNNALHVNNPDGTTIGAVQIVSSSVTVTTVTASTSLTTLLAANANRVGFTIYNNSSANMYFKFGGSASTSNFSFVLGGLDAAGVGDLWDPAIGFCWTGLVTAVWASTTGSCQVTEFN